MRCADFYKKWEQEPNWCEKTPGAVSQINSYLDLVKEIASKGLEREFIYERFPERAARVIKEDEGRADLLNYVIACLKRDERITAGDLKKFTMVKATPPLPMEKPEPIPELPQLSPDAPMEERLKRDEELLQRAGYQTSGDYDPVTGGRLVKSPPYKITRAPEIIHFTPTPKQWEFIKEAMFGSDFQTPEAVISELVDRAMEEA